MYLILKYSDEAWRKVKESAFANSLELEAMYRSRLPWPLKDFESVAEVVSPPLEPTEATPAPSSEPTGDATEDRPLYISDKPYISKKRKRQVKRKSHKEVKDV